MSLTVKIVTVLTVSLTAGCVSRLGEKSPEENPAQEGSETREQSENLEMTKKGKFLSLANGLQISFRKFQHDRPTPSDSALSETEAELYEVSEAVVKTNKEDIAFKLSSDFIDSIAHPLPGGPGKDIPAGLALTTPDERIKQALYAGGSVLIGVGIILGLKHMFQTEAKYQTVKVSGKKLQFDGNHYYINNNAGQQRAVIQKGNKFIPAITETGDPVYLDHDRNLYAKTDPQIVRDREAVLADESGKLHIAKARDGKKVYLGPSEKFLFVKGEVVHATKHGNVTKDLALSS